MSYPLFQDMRMNSDFVFEFGQAAKPAGAVLRFLQFLHFLQFRSLQNPSKTAFFALFALSRRYFFSRYRSENLCPKFSSLWYICSPADWREQPKAASE